MEEETRLQEPEKQKAWYKGASSRHISHEISAILLPNQTCIITIDMHASVNIMTCDITTMYQCGWGQFYWVPPLDEELRSCRLREGESVI